MFAVHGWEIVLILLSLSRKKTMLELALRQQGSETTRQAAVTALSKEKDATIGLIKVGPRGLHCQADPLCDSENAKVLAECSA